MVSALLLLLASDAASPVPAVRLQAVATARIVSGERIGLASKAEVPSAQRTIRVRRDPSSSQPRQLRLVEFQ
jgi:hypothetical protein